MVLVVSTPLFSMSSVLMASRNVRPETLAVGLAPLRMAVVQKSRLCAVLIGSTVVLNTTNVVPASVKKGSKVTPYSSC